MINGRYHVISIGDFSLTLKIKIMIVMVIRTEDNFMINHKSLQSKLDIYNCAIVSYFQTCMSLTNLHMINFIEFMCMVEKRKIFRGLRPPRLEELLNSSS